MNGEIVVFHKYLIAAAVFADTVQNFKRAIFYYAQEARFDEAIRVIPVFIYIFWFLIVCECFSCLFDACWICSQNRKARM